jgi:hypothetical protein
MRKSRYHPENRKHAQGKSIYMHDRLTRYAKEFMYWVYFHEFLRRHSLADLDRWKDVPCLTTEQMKTDINYMAALKEVERRSRRLKLATEALQVGKRQGSFRYGADLPQELMRPLLLAKEIMRAGLDLQNTGRDELNNKVNNILPAVEDFKAIRALQLETRELSSSSIIHDAPFKVNAAIAAESLKSTKYKASSDIARIAELKTEVRRHREQYWQQRRLAYLPPETKKDEEDLTLSLGSKCPLLWSLQFLYKLMLLTILWAGMLRRGEIQSSADDGWRRSTVFGTRLDRKGRTQADLDILDHEENEDRQLEWTNTRTLLVSAQSFAPL